MNYPHADPLRKSTQRQSLPGPEARLSWAQLRPGPHKRRVPLPRARPMRATCWRCSARAAWGPHPKVPVAASELADRASFSLLASRTLHSLPRSPQHVPPKPYEHLLEKDTSGDEICALGQRFPRPPERFQPSAPRVSCQSKWTVPVPPFVTKKREISRPPLSRNGTFPAPNIGDSVNPHPACRASRKWLKEHPFGDGHYLTFCLTWVLE